MTQVYCHEQGKYVPEGEENTDYEVLYSVTIIVEEISILNGEKSYGNSDKTQYVETGIAFKCPKNAETLAYYLDGKAREYVND